NGDSVPDGSVVFSAIPTQALREVIATIQFSPLSIFINGAKGIEQNTHLLPYEIVKELLPEVEYLTLMGPSFAGEVKSKMPTLVNLGYRNEEAAQRVKDLMQTDYFRIRLTKSIRSLELSAAFKNIYAIASGIAEGLGFGTNTRVKLILLAIEEVDRLRLALGFNSDDQSLPATVGDLILTSSSEESRNFRFGEGLTHLAPEEALAQIKETVEGYYTALSVPHFEIQTSSSFLLAHFVYDVCYSESDISIRDRFMEFVKRA
ncbi:MAG: hypothetical protein KA477_03095, partial [Candidatus Levybacteria bacterium]|nr:hypothetical protein [Candidatus Levybacteria bacterium]